MIVSVCVLLLLSSHMPIAAGFLNGYPFYYSGFSIESGAILSPSVTPAETAVTTDLLSPSSNFSLIPNQGRRFSSSVLQIFFCVIYQTNKRDVTRSSSSGLFDIIRERGKKMWVVSVRLCKKTDNKQEERKSFH